MEMQHKEVEVVKRKSTFNCKVLVVRFLALTLTLVAAVVLGVGKQTTTVAITLVPSLPPVNLPVTAKWKYLSASVYFVVANAIACFYATMSLVLILATRGANKNMSLIVIILDVIMVALLLSAVGATGSVGLIGYQGNSHVQWNKVCNVFDKFCHQLTIAVVLSFIGSITYLLLVVLAVFNLHSKF